MKQHGVILKNENIGMKHKGIFHRLSIAIIKAFSQKVEIKVKLKNLINP